jgi:predicted RNA binding protein YcfA (HicA-like mRNA interferase family)
MKLPRITANEVIKAITKLGYFLSRQKGSHKIFKNASGQRLVVPCHSGKEIHPKIIKSIIEQCKITIDELNKLIKNLL